MKKLYFLDEDEKNRILNLHENATKRQYLSEQPNFFNDQLKLQNKQNQVVVQGDGSDPYQYMKWGDKLWYAKKSEGKNPKWIEAKSQKGIEAIKTKIYGLQGGNSAQSATKKGVIKVGTTSTTKTPEEKKSFFSNIAGGIKRFWTNAVSFVVPIHLRIFYDFLSLRKKPFTLSDMSTDEQTALKQMVQYAYQHGFKNGGNVDFYNIANKMNSDGEKFDFKDKTLGLNQFNLKNEYTKIAMTIGNASVTKTGNGFKVKDIYDFNNYYKHPEKYTLKELPNTVTDSMKKAFSGNLVQGVEQMASYYEKLGYKGFPVDIDVPV